MFTQPNGFVMDAQTLSHMIRTHQSNAHKYMAMKNMYEGAHDILRKPRKAEYKPDNRLVANFAKYIVDTFNGYFIGVPVKVSHDDSAVQDYLEYVDTYNDQDDNNAELAKICSIYGHGYELIFNDEAGQVGITYMTPLECFVVYDDSIRRRPLYGVRYFINHEGQLEGSFSNASTITYFVDTKDGIVFTDEIAHHFGDVPIVEYLENEERQSIFANVMTLINEYNKALSEKANDVDYYADAYLKIIGALLDEERLKTLRDNRIINLAGDDAERVVVDFLQKPDADGTQENLLNRVERLIFQLAMVANISDENFGETSGVAMKLKLKPMSDMAQNKERKFASGMNRRYKLIAAFPGSKMSALDWVGIRYKFTRNLLTNLLEESQIAQNLAGIASTETQLSVLSIVDSPRDELERRRAEIEEAPLTRQAVTDGTEGLLD